MQRLASRVLSSAFSVVILALVLAYPVLSYLGIQHLSAAQFALAIMFTFAVRFVLVKEARYARQWPVLVGVVIFCSLVMIFDSQQLLRYYPFLMNAGLGLIFLYSLRSENCLIEQFLEASGKTPPVHAIGYLKVLSAVWGVFLITNAIVSAYTACCTSEHTWALYNGFLSYVAIAVFAAIELTYRQYYKRRRGIIDE